MDSSKSNFGMFSNLSFLYKKIWVHRKQYFLYMGISSLLSIISPFIVILIPRYILNELITTKRPEYVLGLILALVLSKIVINNLIMFFSNFTDLSMKYMMVPLSIDFCKKNIEMDFEDTEDPAILDEKEKAKNLLLSANSLEDYLRSINNLFINIFRLLGFAYIVITVHWAVLLIIITASIINTWMGIRFNKINYKVHEEMAPVDRKWSYLQDVSSNVPFGKTIRIYQLANWMLKKAKENRKEYRNLQGKIIRNNTVLSFLGFAASGIQELTTYIFLINKVVNEQMLVGDFSMYLNSIMQVPGALNAILGSYIGIKNNDLIITQYRNFLGHKSRLQSYTKDYKKISNDLHSIEFVNVSFKYPRTEEYILKDINITIKPGEKLSIVGENGAGKTTFIKLLLRLYDPTEGKILLDNIDIKEYEYFEYMGIMATIFQDYKILAFSILENVSMNESDESNIEKVKNALTQAGVSEKVHTLANGIYTPLSRQYEEDGITLSGGEFQKLALARALYKNAPIIILDEPTSSLSPLAEYEIYKKFNEMVANKTAIYISHRLSSSLFCDNVAVFMKGRIVEYGTHDELMEVNGIYYEMFSLQASYYTDKGMIV